MTPTRILVGESKAIALTVDGFALPGLDQAATLSTIRAIAADLAPYPPQQRSYPGLRRVITAGDGAACSYLGHLLRAIAPYIGSAYDWPGFAVTEASFSLTTFAPDQLAAQQRAPHFDTSDPDVIAMLHYLAPTAGTGFFRHRASGIEVVTPDNASHFISLAGAERAATPPGYIAQSNCHYELLTTIEGLANRIVFYPGCLLHSALITPETPLDSDPLAGRLTTVMFVRRTRG